MSNFPSFKANPAIDMMEMGITPDMYNKLVAVAKQQKCVIMIRKTNKGSVMPFVHHVAVGKKLPTKGKSSDAFFTKGSIPFFAQMAKKLDPDKWYEEQTTLISILSENIKAKRLRESASKYKYIPKLFTEEDIAEFRKNSELTFDDKDKSSIKITVGNDKIAGETKKVIYRLQKTTWENVNAEFSKKLVRPYNSSSSNETLYRLYMKTSGVNKYGEGTGYPRDFKLFVDKTDENRRPDLINILTKLNCKLLPKVKLSQVGPESPRYYQVSWKQFRDYKLWKYSKDTIENENAVNNNAPYLKKDGNENQNYREVRVLGIFTQGKADGEGEKKYFEVVADYDLFMIAPAIDNFMSCPEGHTVVTDVSEGNFTDTEDDLSSNLEKDWWLKNLNPSPDINIAPIYISQSDKEKKKYGIYSSYEVKHVRKEINKALGIKAVQHGVETANLFHTSDLKDPVIAIYPDGIFSVSPNEATTVSGGPLFFVSLTMLFEMISGDRKVGKLIDREREKETFNEIWKDSLLNWKDGNIHSFSNDYANIFNLNWGTKAYYDFNFGKNKNYIENSGNFIDNIEKEYYDLLNSLIYSKNRANFLHLFGLSTTAKTNTGLDLLKVKDLPLSVKAFYVFLYRDYSRFANRLSERIGKQLVRWRQGRKQKASTNETASPAKNHEISPRESHYKFIKKLMFLSEYYKSVHAASKGFGTLVYGDDDKAKPHVAEIQMIYFKAIVGIQKVLEAYKQSNFPDPFTSTPVSSGGTNVVVAKRRNAIVGNGSPPEWSKLDGGVAAGDKNSYEHDLTTLIQDPDYSGADKRYYSPFYRALHTYIKKNSSWINSGLYEEKPTAT